MGSYSDEEGVNPDWGFYGSIRNNTYKGLRLIGNGYSIYYSVHCTGERELYDSTVGAASGFHVGKRMLTILAEGPRSTDQPV